MSTSSLDTASAISAVTAFATSTVSALAASRSALSASASVSASAGADEPWAWSGDTPELAGALGNGTVVPVGSAGSGLDDGAGAGGEGSYALNMLVGLLIVLVASLFNALGLNLTKLDHTQQQNVSRRQRRPPWTRLMWLGGMGVYITLTAVGSPLALRYLRPDWVAPLGASSLVFNFLFARWLVGTPVTPTDIRGTALIVLGVILILVFSSINHGLSQSLSISRLDSLWSRAAWLAYFLALSALTALVALFAHLVSALLRSRASFSPLSSPSLPLPTMRAPPGPVRRAWAGCRALERALLGRLERACGRTPDARLIWLEGIGWAVCGGSLAGLCLVFTKAVVKISGLPGHPFAHFSSVVTTLLVVATAVLQIVCLNKALQCADTVVVVPLFYAGYTVFGFTNSLVFYAETGQFARWVLVAVFVSIAVLISGVVLLSLKQTPEANTTVSAAPAASMRLHPRQRAAADTGAGMGTEASGIKADEADVMWGVGSASDAGSADSDGDDEATDAGRGTGAGRSRGSGVGGASGERGRLLHDNEADASGAGDGECAQDDKRVRHDGDGDQEPRVSKEEDEFGEYEAVRLEER
ncbi:hypothetical protein Q5752_001645 [Cryptotrichosporon argae]